MLFADSFDTRRLFRYAAFRCIFAADIDSRRDAAAADYLRLRRCRHFLRRRRLLLSLFCHYIFFRPYFQPIFAALIFAISPPLRRFCLLLIYAAFAITLSFR